MQQHYHSLHHNTINDVSLTSVARFLAAVFIPPEKQNPKMFLHCFNYGPETCVGVKRRREAIAQQNKSLTPEETEIRVSKSKLHLLELQQKLKAQGVDCLFQVCSQFMTPFCFSSIYSKMIYLILNSPISG